MNFPRPWNKTETVNDPRAAYLLWKYAWVVADREPTMRRVADARCAAENALSVITPLVAEPERERLDNVVYHCTNFYRGTHLTGINAEIDRMAARKAVA